LGFFFTSTFSLNASHDGEDNGCSSFDDYIMSAVRSGNSDNRWVFSPCSAKSIDTFLQNIKGYGWMDRWMDRRMDGWMNGWMDGRKLKGWMDG
jgi:hypothetical protein